MITEDYVSFEIAKLLKEKGFNEDCIKVYINEELRDVITKESIEECTHCFNHYLYPGDATAPTHQMAMKWLREVHNIVVVIFPIRTVNGELAYNASIYNTDAEHKKLMNKDYQSYEQASEETIKYCLEKLI